MRKKILFVLGILFGLMMINAGLNKFLNYMPAPEMPKEAAQLVKAFMQSGWLIPLIAIVEIIGGILFATQKFKALGAIILLPIMVGIVLFHIFQAPDTVAVSIVLFAINIWAIVENKDKYLSLIK